MPFHPDKLNRYSRLGKIIKLTGWTPKEFYWQYKTICDYEDKGPGINRHCTDISKSKVNECFEKSFGYSSFVDPLTEGKAVIKSEKNFAHDGEIVDLPVTVPKGKVCQKLIDTETEEGFVDWRPLIVMGRVKGYIKKVKPKRFDSGGSAMSYHSKWAFNPAINFTIEHFCQLIGMDYGELDVLSDDDLYIVDANKTPGGASKVESLGDDFINDHRELFV